MKNTFATLSGYYTTLHVMLLLAYMALCRIRTVEQLQYESPGELGNLMGLDRVPEVRCLRNKLKELSQGQDEKAPDIWAGLLSKDWMEEEPDLAGTLYVDGHVRLYHGKQTQLPRRYVSRQRLCLRGTTDYWVNDALGQPFFSIERPIDHGMLEARRAKRDILFFGFSCAIALGDEVWIPSPNESDKGVQFWCKGYKRWCKTCKFEPRFGAIGQYGTIAVIERFMRPLNKAARYGSWFPFSATTSAASCDVSSIGTTNCVPTQR